MRKAAVSILIGITTLVLRAEAQTPPDPANDDAASPGATSSQPQTLEEHKRRQMS